MPPEQVLGAAGPASDLYALGMTVLAAAAGRPATDLPVDAGRAKVRARQIGAEVGASPALVATLERMVEPLAKDRPASAAEALAMLDGSWRSPRRRGRWIALALALAAGAGGALGYRFVSRPVEPRHVDPPVDPPAPVNRFFGRVFLVEAEGDGAPDLLGHDYTGGFFTVSGATGKTLWNAHAPVDWLTGHGRLILGWRERAFLLRGFDARTGQEIWTTQLSNVFESARFGVGCVVVTTAGKREIGLDAAKGTPTPCAPPEGAPSFSRDGQDGKTPGAAAGGLLVVEKKVGDPDYGFVLSRLDPRTHQTLRSIEVATPRSIHRVSVLAQGAWAWVESSGAVYAFDAQTLERRW
jgi:hypothetical protein